MMLLQRIDGIITLALNETLNWTELQANSGDDLTVRAHLARLNEGESLRLQFLPLQEAGVRLPVGETSASHSHVFQQAQVLHLVAAALFLKEQRGLDVVGLDAADVVGFLQRGDSGTGALATAGVGDASSHYACCQVTPHLACQVLYQRDHGVFEERSSRQRSFGDLGDAQFALGPHDLQHGVGTGCRSDPTEFQHVSESGSFPLAITHRP